MSILYRAYGNVADCRGSGANTVYATARSATTLTTSAATSSLVCGQDFTTPNYNIQQAFFQFDTSTFPASGSASLSLNVPIGATVPGDVIEVSQTSALTNKLSGTALTSLTQLGSFVATTSTGRVQTALSGSMPVSATLRYVCYAQNERLNVAPTANQTQSYSAADSSGTASDPYVQILTGTVWDHVSIGTSVEVTATTHTLIEPAGVAAGDLLVACISSRIASTTSITLPAGWTRVGEAKNNNVLTTSSALPSGMMAYIIRGASAPSYTFTHPAAPAPALGRVIAYRGVKQAVPLDSGTTAVTTGTAITAVSVAGLTTTEDDDLIVALCAGGQEAAWQDFTATDPATGSGTTASSVLDPIWGQWLERADVQTTTSNDTSLAIFDAVKQTAGATGNLTATASVSAGHVVVAGSFKINRPGPSFRSLTSTSYASRTNTVLTAPAGLANGDILIATIVTALNPTAPTPTPPAGFASFGTATSVTDASSVNAKLHVFWKRAASEAGSYTFTHATSSSQGVLAAYGGCVASGTPLGATSNNSGTGNAAVGTGITTTAANSALLWLSHDWQGAGGVLPPTGMAERFENFVYLADQPIASIGATGNKSQTNSNFSGADQWAVRMVELLETAPAGTTYNDAIAETAAAVETVTLLTESKVRELENGVDWRETESGAIRITEGDFFVIPPIDVSVAESASAADTVTATRTYTCAVAENGGANETVGNSALRIGAVAETAAAADTSTGLLTRIGAVAETASAAETTDASIVPAAGIFDVMVVETAPVVDATDTLVVGTRAIVEAASAAETITKAVIATAAIAETAAAVDTIGGLMVRIGAVAESASAAETVNGLRASTAAIVETAAAAETITYSLTGAAGTTYNEAVLEVGAAADTVTGRLTALGAVAEAASAFETTTRAVSYTLAIAETAVAVDTVGGLRVIVGAIDESTSVGRLTEAGDWREIENGGLRAVTGAAETITATVIPAAGTFNETVAEAASAAETVTVAIVTAINLAVAETAIATETVSATVTPSTDGYIKVWNGTAWDLKPVKVWNGSSWVAQQVKYWNGSSWVDA